MQRKPLFAHLAAFAVFTAVCLLRAMPAFERGTYATEGGEWLWRMWDTGFWQMIFGARGDYGVLGNMVVIKAADLLTQLIGGHSLAACGPVIQHLIACLYVVLTFLFIFSVLRSHHGWWRALLVSTVMLLAPDLDGENRVFGEANNVGFFNALGITFLFYDLWLRREVSLRRLIAYALVVVFHLFTSPMAGLIGAGFSSLLIGRAVWDWKKQGKALPPVLLLYIGTIVLGAWTILQARPEAADPNSEHAAHTASVVLPRFWKTFVELVFCRQVLYPLTLNVYGSFNDKLTIGLLVVVLALIAWWMRTEWRRRSDWREVSIVVLLFAIAVCMSVVTLWSRGWLTQSDQPYTKLWPARYYLIQTMLSTGFIALVLLRAGDLLPRFRRDAITLVLLLGASFAIPQFGVISEAMHHYDPHVVAKRWANQLSRVRDQHLLAGGGALPAEPGTFYDVEMYIDYHFLRVPAPMMAAFVAQQPKLPDNRCEVKFTEANAMKPRTDWRTWSLESSEFRVIPRAQGSLVTFDLLLPDTPHFDVQRRKLWLSAVPGDPKLAADVYLVTVPRDDTHGRKARSNIERMLFKVRLWFDHQLTLSEAQKTFAGMTAALGDAPGNYLAKGTVLPATTEVALSSLPDDDSLLWKQHPVKQAFHWQWKGADLKAKNITVGKGGVGIKEDAPFEEEAYVRLNPDVAAALADKTISSAKAHFEHWGNDGSRQSCVYSATLDVSTAKLTVDKLAGLRIEVSRRNERPGRIRCVLHGAAGEQTALTVVPSEGKGVFDVFQLSPAFLGASHPVQTLELQFEQPQKNRQFHIEDIFLYTRPE